MNEQQGPQTDLAAFLEPFGTLVRRAESREALEHYVTGLMAELPRKTATEIARAIPDAGSQRLQEFLTRTSWEPEAMGAMRVREMVRFATAAPGWLVLGRTAFVKKGAHSVGVERQAARVGGREENCQLLVTSHYVDDLFAWPVAGRLYLPASWAADSRRREAAHVPAEVAYEPCGRLALRVVEESLRAGVPVRGVIVPAVLADGALLDGLTARSLPFIAELESEEGFVELRDAGTAPERLPGLGPTADGAPADDGWERIAWRGSADGASVREFSRVRVRRRWAGRLTADGWMVRERPVAGHHGATRHYHAWELDEMPLPAMVRAAKMTSALDSFYDRARRELGLADYEGRLWSGFHRHVALVMLAESFRLLRRGYGDLIEPADGRRRRREPRPRRAAAPPAIAAAQEESAA
ncbi:MAG TPA: IS701 family transposase [Gemmatimonadaceae bacterium]|nr:IS701 family transposase [Gemmatimonadaceae bacterium]